VSILGIQEDLVLALTSGMSVVLGVVLVTIVALDLNDGRSVGVVVFLVSCDFSVLRCAAAHLSLNLINNSNLVSHYRSEAQISLNTKIVHSLL
jgi:hypothetical protein